MTDEDHPTTAMILFAASPSTTTISSLSVSNTSSMSATANANAILSKPKPTGKVKEMLQAQISMAMSKREFVLKNATAHTIEGYVSLTEEAERLHSAMNAAADTEDFDVAEEHNIKLKRVSKAAEFEHKLYHNCQWAVKHANKKLDELKKNRLFIEMKDWTPLRDAANEYLNKLSEEDLTRFEIDKLTKLNGTTVVSTEVPSSEASSLPPTHRTSTTLVDMTDSVQQVVSTEPDPTKPKAKAARKRSSKPGYTPGNAENEEAEDNTSRPTKDKKKQKTVAQDKPPSLTAFHAFVGNKCYKVTPPKGDAVYVDVTSEHYVMSNGSLYCECCTTVIKWENKARHMVAAKHLNKKKEMIKADNAAAVGQVMMQQRIEKDNLVGKSYDDEKCRSILMWLKIACKGNWSLRSIEDVRVRLCASWPF